MSASQKVMSAMAEGIPLTLLFDVAGFGPTAFELLQREGSQPADRQAVGRVVRSWRAAAPVRVDPRGAVG